MIIKSDKFKKMEKFVTTTFMMEWYDRPIKKNSIDSNNNLYRKLVTVLKDSSNVVPKFTIHTIKMIHNDYCQDVKRLDPEIFVTTENEKKQALTQIDVQNLVSNTIESIFAKDTIYPECDKVKCTVFNTSTNESVIKIFYKHGNWFQTSPCLSNDFSSLKESSDEFGKLVTSLLSADNIKSAINDFMTLKGLVTDILQTIKK